MGWSMVCLYFYLDGYVENFKQNVEEKLPVSSRGEMFTARFCEREDEM